MFSQQLALIAPPLLLLSFWLLWSTRTWRLAPRFALGSVWIVGLSLTFGPGHQVRPAAHMLMGAPESDELWTFALQTPEHRIVRRQPMGDYAGDATLLVRYVWDADARPSGGPAPLLSARINDVDLPPATTAPDPQEFWCCFVRWAVQHPLIATSAVARIEVWLPNRDPRVRFIAQRNPGAARFQVDGSLFFDGVRLIPGVPHTHSGTLRPGFVHVWLEPA